jgi:hypothetical protein
MNRDKKGPREAGARIRRLVGPRQTGRSTLGQIGRWGRTKDSFSRDENIVNKGWGDLNS